MSAAGRDLYRRSRVTSDMSLPERLRRKARLVANGCWMFDGALNGTGYGQLQWEGKRQLVHRLSYELFVGPIPAGLQIDHLCFVRPCFNPAHLEPVTAAENMRRRAARQTECSKGHPFTPENTYWRANRQNARTCRTCNSASSAAYKARRAA